MAWVRVEDSEGAIVFGRLRGEQIELFDGPPWAGGRPDGRSIASGLARLLAPVTPSKIVCVGRNYLAHAKEMGGEVPTEPLLFLKPPSSLLAPGGSIELPAASARVEHEAEIGVVIGARARHVPVSEAMSYVFGYTCVGDVTARDLQRKDGQWTRAKGFDTFCPVGPWVVEGREMPPGPIVVEGRVNGQVRQHGTSAEMAFGVAALVAYVSDVMTLEPGDLIATGTPEGVGPLVEGDRFEVEIRGVGVLSVGVRREPPIE